MKEQLQIAIVQTHLYWEDRKQNLENLSALITGIQGQPDIILLPETFTTGFSMNKNISETGTETVDWMKRMAAQTQSAVAGSFFINEKGKCYNRFHFVQPDGQVTIYNKKHLFRLTNEQEVFSPGNEQVVVAYKGWKITCMVCYDLRFPVWMRRTPAHDYDMILLCANWLERRSFAWNHLLIARAIENQAYVVASNRVGKDGTNTLYAGESVVLDPMGHAVAKGLPFADSMVYATVDYSRLQSIRKSLPFYNDRDEFTLMS